VPNEKLQLRLVRLALRELGGRATSKEVSKWISTAYSRNRVGIKKSRYLLRSCPDIESEKVENDYIFKYRKRKIQIAIIISVGEKIAGSKTKLAKILNSSYSQLVEWESGNMYPSERNIESLDRFVEEHQEVFDE